jgi:hypothetical protein
MVSINYASGTKAYWNPHGCIFINEENLMGTCFCKLTSIKYTWTVNLANFKAFNFFFTNVIVLNQISKILN